MLVFAEPLEAMWQQALEFGVVVRQRKGGTEFYIPSRDDKTYQAADAVTRQEWMDRFARHIGKEGPRQGAGMGLGSVQGVPGKMPAQNGVEAGLEQLRLSMMGMEKVVEHLYTKLHFVQKPQNAMPLPAPGGELSHEPPPISPLGEELNAIARQYERHNKRLAALVEGLDL